MSGACWCGGFGAFMCGQLIYILVASVDATLRGNPVSDQQIWPSRQDQFLRDTTNREQTNVALGQLYQNKTRVRINSGATATVATIRTSDSIFFFSTMMCFIHTHSVIIMITCIVFFLYSHMHGSWMFKLWFLIIAAVVGGQRQTQQLRVKRWLLCLNKKQSAETAWKSRDTMYTSWKHLGSCSERNKEPWGCIIEHNLWSEVSLISHAKQN